MKIREETFVTGKVNGKPVEGHCYRENGVAVVYDNDKDALYKLSEVSDLRIDGKYTVREANEEFNKAVSATLDKYDIGEMNKDPNKQSHVEKLEDIAKNGAKEFGVTDDDAKKVFDEKYAEKSLTSAADSAENGDIEEAEKQLEPFKESDLARLAVRGKISAKIYEALALYSFVKDVRQDLKETGDYAFANSKLTEAKLPEDVVLMALSDSFDKNKNKVFSGIRESIKA